MADRCILPPIPWDMMLYLPSLSDRPTSNTVGHKLISALHSFGRRRDFTSNTAGHTQKTAVPSPDRICCCRSPKTAVFRSFSHLFLVLSRMAEALFLVLLRGSTGQMYRLMSSVPIDTPIPWDMMIPMMFCRLQYVCTQTPTSAYTPPIQADITCNSSGHSIGYFFDFFHIYQSFFDFIKIL